MPEQRKENKKQRSAGNEFAGVPPNPNRPPVKTGPFPNVTERPLKPEEWQTEGQQAAEKFLQKWFNRKPVPK